jgi:dihydroxyacetone kinase-like protein
MTGIKLDYTDIVSILRAVANDMKGHVDELRELDAVVGDGDLGVTVELGADAMGAYLAAPDETDIGKMLASLGMNLNKANPSTFGTLLASAFLGAGRVVQDRPEITGGDLIAMGCGAIDGIKKRGKAEVGDKTMLDSLVPAVEVFEQSYETTGNVEEALKSAAAAAEDGMKATADMKAKFGRASWRSDGGLGHRDAGAAAMYHMIESFARHLAANLI